jgi:hypothetical protein
VAVTRADLVVGQSFDGEVLAGLPAGEVVMAQLFLPVAVGLGLVHEHGPVGLVVAVDVDPSHEPGAVPRVLEDRRGHLAAVPLHVPRRRGVD